MMRVTAGELSGTDMSCFRTVSSIVFGPPLIREASSVRIDRLKRGHQMLTDVAELLHHTQLGLGTQVL